MLVLCDSCMYICLQCSRKLSMLFCPVCVLMSVSGCITIHHDINAKIFLGSRANAYLKIFHGLSHHFYLTLYSKTCLKRPLKNRQNKDLKDKAYWIKVLRNAPLEAERRMLPLEQFALLLTLVKP